MGPLECAFVGAVFSGANWNCETMSALLRLLDADGCFVGRSNDRSIGVIPLPDDYDGHLVMRWYKQHGRIEAASVLAGDSEYELTLDLAEAVLLARHH